MSHHPGALWGVMQFETVVIKPLCNHYLFFNFYFFNSFVTFLKIKFISLNKKKYNKIKKH
ncbi:hypothetical protein HanIR_Chr14g0681881 [Helianthus annuus]|nr:hypothetical protein HanIR_Chr14g0681881 [Helianthus annuus]